MPERYQMQRIRGWRTPPNGINCARPSRWGNPFLVHIVGRDLAVELFDDEMYGAFDAAKLDHLTGAQIRTVMESLRDWRKRHGPNLIREAQLHLAGHDLGCFCRLDEKCHVSILLRVANP